MTFWHVKYLCNNNNNNNSIATSLCRASLPTVLQIPFKCLKPFWSDDLDRLTEASLDMHSLWCQCGKPRCSIINSARLKDNYDYKCAIKKVANDFESANADEISDHLPNKDNNKFWRAWNNKYKYVLDAAVSVEDSSDPMTIAAVSVGGSSDPMTIATVSMGGSSDPMTIAAISVGGSSDPMAIAAISVGGSSDPMAIAASFRDYYSSIYVHSAADSNAFAEFNDLFAKQTNSNNNNDAMPRVDVELIEMCVKHLKSGKAAGAARQLAEHIINAAPSFGVFDLKLLFSLFLSHGYVPDASSFGNIIPIVKDKSGDPNLLDNYRPFTLSPVIFQVV